MKTVLFIAPLFIFVSCKLLGGGDDNYSPEIVFSAEDEAGTTQIYTMNDDGSKVTRLTNYSSDGDCSSPSWSPDGKHILFSTFYKSTSIGPGMWVMDADGSDKHPLHKYQAEGYSGALEGNNARWSPDGTKVVYDLCPNCQIATNYDIYLFDTQTKEVTQLTTDSASDLYPTWSPDGSRIAFVSDRDYKDADTLRFRNDLYMVDVDGSNLHRITETEYATRPVWGPKGDKIVYESNIQGNEVFVYDINSKEITKIKTGLKFTGNPLWNKQGSELMVFGRETSNSTPEMRLISIENNSSELLQIIRLDDKAIGRNYDWYDEE